MTTTVFELPHAVTEGLGAGSLAPYLGPGMLALCEGATPPADPLTLAAALTAKVSVPGKIKNRLTAAAQFIENFKHRKTLVKAMVDAYAVQAVPSPLHRWIAALPVPLIVDAWYDDTLRSALGRMRTDWAEVQGLSQSEHFGTWVGWYDANGQAMTAPFALRAVPPSGSEPSFGRPCGRLAPDPMAAPTVLYKPWGGRAPAANFLVSDTDHVEVLTEIDIQTPIPELVQRRRGELGFVFLGCRFNDQLPRAFARQIMKRSKGPHFAVMPDEPTRMEARFLDEQGITRIAMPLADVASALTGAVVAA